ncbi:hypothetical protein [uncultured Kordia sp.]|uniref:hypothetical protein n=1 Tax=uncultured Kordia sp. TaxID=507699 RepID=UPI00263221E1|nr:hypothetical protein [uncultured Kordia sp.]
MKKKIKYFILIIIGIIVLHDNGLLPFHLQWYSMTLQEHGSFCEIQDGALAGKEDIQYRFLFANGTSLVRGDGTRVIELREKEELSLGFGGYIPILKDCNPTVKFECYDVKNNKSLGVIGAEYICNVKGFLSRPDLKKIIYSKYIQQMHSKLSTKEQFIDDLTYREGVTATNFWDAHQTLMLSLTKAGETIAPIRKINLKKGIMHSRDSLLFSTHLGDTAQYNYEILTVDREKKEISIKRYSNNGELIIEAFFEELGKPDISRSVFKPIKEGWRSSAGLTLSKYRRSNEVEFTFRQ